MTVNEILQIIPENIFDELSAETEVDYQVKKLTGETIFKLILFSMLGSNKSSLRVMDKFLASAHFKCFNRRTRRAKRGKKTKSPYQCKYNSIRDRISTMDVAYFEKLFEIIFRLYNKELKEEKALSKVDTTYITLAAKLFSFGINHDGSDKRKYLKYGIALKGSLPCSVKMFTEQPYNSDDLALTDLINDLDSKDDVVVFDRGLQSRKSFDKFTTEDKLFITRSKLHILCTITQNIALGVKPEGSTVTITSDQIGYLSSKRNKSTVHQYRVIKGIIDGSGDEICFITNILEEDVYNIAKWYKERWEIELFFKFIKQHLNATHLNVRNENGIKIMIYMTMILATLIIVYKKTNKIKGYKIAKQKFEIELDNDMTKAIVILCGGDPNKASYLWNDT